MIESFVLYADMYEEIKLLSVEQKGQLLDLIFNYATSGDTPDIEDLALKIVFSTIKRALDMNHRKYQETVERRRAAGKKGGAPFGNQNASKTNKSSKRLNFQANQPDTENDNVNDSENVPVNDNVFSDKPPAGETTDQTKTERQKKARFVPPTVEEVKAFCAENCISINAEYFTDYYAANGWTVGKNKMKDWKAAVRNWARREYGTSPGNKIAEPSKSVPAYKISDIQQHTLEKYKALQ